MISIRAIRFWKFSLIILLVAACSQNNQDSVADKCTCVNDPTTHCIITDGCTHSGQCASGTVCRSMPFENDTESGLKNLDKCLLPTEMSVHRTALINGFNVESFELEKSPDSAVALFSWRKPAAAMSVICALFGCMPEIIKDGDRLSIINFDQCVLAKEIFTEDDATFSLSDDRFTHKNYEENPNETCNSHATEKRGAWDQYHKITGLSVGCWAYSNTSLVGATELVQILPEESYPYHETFVSNLEDCKLPANKGKSCLFNSGATIPYYGTCFNSACRQRCLNENDCVSISINRTTTLDSVAIDGGELKSEVASLDAGAAVSFICETKVVDNEEPKYVGVCMPQNWREGE